MHFQFPSMKWLGLLVLALSTSKSVEGQVSSNVSLFAPGREYVYKMSLSATAGSTDYVSFGSVFNITGDLHVQYTGNKLNVKIEDILLGTYNGELDMTNPNPSATSFKPNAQLAPLSEPFQVKVETGKVTEIVLNKNVDEWARNFQRGIATALQFDLAKVSIGETENSYVQEETVVGNCMTNYVTVPNVNANIGQAANVEIRKSRDHTQCSNVPTRSRRSLDAKRYCSDGSRNLLSSKAEGVYELVDQDGILVARSIRVGSAQVYTVGLLGAVNDRVRQMTNSLLTLNLKEVKAGTGAIPGPTSPQTFDNLQFGLDSTTITNILPVNNAFSFAGALIQKNFSKIYCSMFL